MLLVVCQLSHDVINFIGYEDLECNSHNHYYDYDYHCYHHCHYYRYYHHVCAR